MKDNVGQYLELKNKVAEFISDIVSRTGEYATELLDKFKANVIAIFGFLFTVVIAGIVSDQPLNNILQRYNGNPGISPGGFCGISVHLLWAVKVSDE